MKINKLAILITTVLLSSSLPETRADDDRVKALSCDANGDTQSASWAWKADAEGKLGPVTIGTSGSTERTASAKCVQTSTQARGGKGTFKPKAADGRGGDACAKAIVHPPTDTPPFCKDVVFPCGSGAAESAPKPSE